MKKMICIAALTALIAAGARQAAAVLTNLGESRTLETTANDLTVSGAQAPGSILYAPSESDDPAFRASIAAFSGGVVDYFNAAAGTPDLPLLQRYGCVFTWSDFAYADQDAFGDNLADYVDAGGNVVLGAFSTFTSNNPLAGRIMSPGYAPVNSPSSSNHFSASAYSGDGVSRLYAGVAAFNCTFRDVLALQGPGIQDGTYLDGEIACAYRPDFKVVYANGQAGSPGTCSGDGPRLIANACSAAVASKVSTPAIARTGMVGLALALAAAGIVIGRRLSVSSSRCRSLTFWTGRT